MPGGSRTKTPSLVEETAWASAAALAARTYGVRPAQVLDCRGRLTRACGPLRSARRAALYLANVGLNQPVRALCRATGLDHTTISHHLRAVEDDRDLVAELDELMEVLTSRLQTGMAQLGAAAGLNSQPLALPAPRRAA